MLTRRCLLALGAAVAVSGKFGPLAAQEGEAAAVLSFGDPEPFTPALVRRLARRLAREEFAPPDNDLPGDLGELTYDQYRDIRFRSEAAVWRGEAMPYEVQLFHRGHVFRNPAQIEIVSEGESRRIRFSPNLFSYGALVEQAPPEDDIGFAGFRIHAPLNRPEYYDEFTVFQGASYFRAIGAGQTYGISARGLAIATAEVDGEEFPYFRHFWIERPRAAPGPIVVHALLDSPSTTGAYRFTIRPGAATAMDVEATLYPRTDLERVGLAPLTSMFFFSAHDRVGVDDFRPAVHDSDGLLIWNGHGEWLWRPLVNPETLQTSAFIDEHPQGFGLMQRARRFHDFEDLEARYELRPSLWVEPIGDWGDGSVVLVEIPTDAEIHDNIVAFWRPGEPLAAGTDHQFTYRLHWAPELPVDSGLARIRRTMIGRSMGRDERSQNRHRVVIEFAGGNIETAIAEGVELRPDVTASAGTLHEPVLQANPETGGYRVSFEYEPDGANPADLRCTLRRENESVSEVWVFRWAN